MRSPKRSIFATSRNLFFLYIIRITPRSRLGLPCFLLFEFQTEKPRPRFFKFFLAIVFTKWPRMDIFATFGKLTPKVGLHAKQKLLCTPLPRFLQPFLCFQKQKNKRYNRDPRNHGRFRLLSKCACADVTYFVAIITSMYCRSTQ